MGLLLMDIGRGTQDLLLYRPGERWENSIQLVLPSPTVLLAAAVAEATARGEDIFLTGVTMGGGPLSKAVRRHLSGGRRAWATPDAAATFDDDLEEVRAMGVSIVGEEEGRSLAGKGGVKVIQTGDVDLQALERSLSAWGISFPITAAAVAVQDHGRAPRGTSDRRYRFLKFREMLSASSDLKTMAYGRDELPEHLTRMQGVKRSLGCPGPVLFMDTGVAALLGMLSDARVGGADRKLLLNVGNGHTLAGIVEGESLLGLFEHHTRLLDREGLGRWLDGLVEGTIGDEEVYSEGGHGAVVVEGKAMAGWKEIDLFAATGPRRSLAAGLKRAPYPAAPHGQMMLTGNYGLYRAFEARWGPYEE